MDGLTLFHVAAGSAALLAGGAALAVRKGGRLHAKAGTIFFAAMLAMAGTGALIAALRPERGTAVIGIFTCYLVATSWLAARRRDGGAGGFERAGLAVALACAAAMLASACSPRPARAAGSTACRRPPIIRSLSSPRWRRASTSTSSCAAGSPRHQRIARHLWRMCAALAIAAFSFFLGQQDEFPAAWRGLAIWFVPPFAVLAAMAFWLVRVRFTAAFGRPAPNRQSAYQS